MYEFLSVPCGGGKKYKPVTQVICVSSNGATTYTVIAQTAYVEYMLTASTKGGWIKLNDSLVNSVSAAAGKFNTVSGNMNVSQGDVITFQSQGGNLSNNFVKITEGF